MPVKTFSTFYFRHRGERGTPKPTLGGKLLMHVDAARWKSVDGHTLFPDRHGRTVRGEAAAISSTDTTP